MVVTRRNTSRLSAGHLTPVSESGSIEERLQRGWKVLKAPVRGWLVTRVLVLRNGGAVMLRCLKIFKVLAGGIRQTRKIKGKQIVKEGVLTSYN